eukprot:6179421-Pleurochrysis_carterae.AAC.2
MSLIFLQLEVVQAAGARAAVHGGEVQRARRKSKSPLIQAVVVTEPGLDTQEYSFEEPMPLAADSVEVEVLACTLGHTDTQQLRGDWGTCLMPLVPGREAVGVVVAVGRKVKSVQLGQRVGVLLGSGMDSENDEEGADRGALDFMTIGAAAERLRVPAAWAFPLPVSIPSPHACGLLSCGGPIWSQLTRRKLPRGAKVAIVGGGTAGFVAAHIASGLGFETFTMNAARLDADRGVDVDEKKLPAGVEDALDAENPEHLRLHGGSIDALLCVTACDELDLTPLLPFLRRQRPLHIRMGRRLRVDQFPPFFPAPAPHLTCDCPRVACSSLASMRLICTDTVLCGRGAQARRLRLVRERGGALHRALAAAATGTPGFTSARRAAQRQGGPCSPQLQRTGAHSCSRSAHSHSSASPLCMSVRVDIRASVSYRSSLRAYRCSKLVLHSAKVWPLFNLLCKSRVRRSTGFGCSTRRRTSSPRPTRRARCAPSRRSPSRAPCSCAPPSRSGGSRRARRRASSARRQAAPPPSRPCSASSQRCGGDRYMSLALTCEMRFACQTSTRFIAQFMPYSHVISYSSQQTICSNLRTYSVSLTLFSQCSKEGYVSSPAVTSRVGGRCVFRSAVRFSSWPSRCRSFARAHSLMSTHSCALLSAQVADESKRAAYAMREGLAQQTTKLVEQACLLR